MRTMFFVVLLLLGMISQGIAGNAVKFVVDAQPGAFLISSKIRGAEASRSDQGVVVDSSVSLMPNVRIGIGVITDNVIFDFTGGGGVLINPAFYAPFARIDAAARFKLGNAASIGPHAGLLFFSEPTWDTIGDANYSSATGLLAGLDFTVGRNYAFKASLDYLLATFASKAPPRLPGSSFGNTELDVSGVALQLGFIRRF